MARGLDHIVHAVRDLDAAAELYRRLGFQVSGRNRHPPVWGTQNHIIQFDGCYVELLGLSDMSQTAPHGPRYFSFGAFNRDFLARTEGLAMLVLHDDAEREYAYGPAQGLPDTKVGTFSQALYDEAKKNGWTVISMKNDWKVIFPFESK